LGRSYRIRFLDPVSKARDFDKSEGGAASHDIALVSPTDQQLRFCLCGLAAARRENIFGSWQIFQLTFDSSSGIGRHPTEILEESCTTSPTCSTPPEGSRGITILEKRSGAIKLYWHTTCQAGLLTIIQAPAKSNQQHNEGCLH
jgi:hypothetical protein